MTAIADRFLKSMTPKDETENPDFYKFMRRYSKEEPGATKDEDIIITRISIREYRQLIMEVEVSKKSISQNQGVRDRNSKEKTDWKIELKDKNFRLIESHYLQFGDKAETGLSDKADVLFKYNPSGNQVQLSYKGTIKKTVLVVQEKSEDYEHIPPGLVVLTKHYLYNSGKISAFGPTYIHKPRKRPSPPQPKGEFSVEVLTADGSPTWVSALDHSEEMDLEGSSKDTADGKVLEERPLNFIQGAVAVCYRAYNDCERKPTPRYKHFYINLKFNPQINRVRIYQKEKVLYEARVIPLAPTA